MLRMEDEKSSIFGMIRELWNVWDVPLFVMLSLTLQFFLTWFAALRKRVSHLILHFSIWLAYLLADWVVAFTIGLIHYKGSKAQAATPGELSPLLSSWAPFLVVHLGGPDTITAYSLTDNELWKRHLLRCIAQAVATCNILYQMPPSPDLLWVPTVLVFICGLFKYAERVSTLYFASMGKFRSSNLRKPHPGSNYAMLMQEYALMRDDNFPTRIEKLKEPELEHDLYNCEVKQKGGPLQQAQIIKDAYGFYQRFKGLIVDFEYSFRVRNKSVQYFLSLKDDDAFKVVETELNFIYDTFYTKSFVLHKRRAYVVRSLCLCLMIISFGIFSLWDNLRVHHVDAKHVRVTYILLSGGIALELISIVLIIFSDWNVALLAKDLYNADDRPHVFSRDNNKRILRPDKMSAFKTQWLSSHPNAPYLAKLLFQPWSRSIRRFSLLSYYISHRSPRLDKGLDHLGVKTLVDELTYVHSSSLSYGLKQLILQEIRTKSKLARTPQEAKHLCSVRGDWVLDSYGKIKEVEDLKEWIKDVEYDESFLLWHIATELCYYATLHTHYEEKNSMSKVLSDYMVYLLVMKPMMISNVAGISELRLLDTEAEALCFIRGSEFIEDDRTPESLA